MKKRCNDEFYDDGVFNEKKAKQAFFDMMNHYNYPIPDSFHGDHLWCPDFDLGDFANVGMGGVFWMNHNHDGGGYLGHEIFLLPGQMIVEHAHVAVDGVCPPKQESWLIRHGSIYNFSVEDEPTGFPEGVEIPESQKGFTTVNSCSIIKEGEVGKLKKAGSMHFMMGGPEGAIVTEFGTYHTNDALRFTHPKLQFGVKE